MKTIRKQDERGIVSMIVAMIIMLVISILVVAFSRVAQREQRLALDNQLGAQAYYAAETGVNDAVNSISQAYASGDTWPPAGAPPHRGCYNGSLGNQLPTSGSAYSLPIDGPSGVITYSCVLVTPTVDAIVKAPLGNKSQVFPITTQGSATPIQSITVSWEDSQFGHTGNVTGCTNLATGVFPGDYSSLPNCQVGIIEMDVVPTVRVSRGALDVRDFRMFLVPSSGGVASITYDAVNNNADIYPVTCVAATAAPYACKVTIDVPGDVSYYARVRSLYRESNLSVSAYGSPGAGGAPMQLFGAQAQIDSTGLSNDVLHRIQVRVALSSSNAVPDFALDSSSDICKRFLVIPGSAAIPDVNALRLSPLCQLN